MEVSGKVIEVCPIERGASARGPWAKATVVVRYEEGQYPRDIVLTSINKAEDFVRLHVGDAGVFKFDAKARKGNNGRWFCDLNCWSWSITSAAAPAPAAAAAPAPTDDDIPF